MKIAIISDVHDNLVNLEKILKYCNQEKITTIICLGDLANLESLDFLNDNFKGEIIHYVLGNMDIENLDGKTQKLKNYKKTKIYSGIGKININEKKVGFTHFPHIAKVKASNFNLIFYGHTHKPWEEIIDSCKLLNPGTAGGVFYPPTFAIWDVSNDKFELIRLEKF